MATLVDATDEVDLDDIDFSQAIFPDEAYVFSGELVSEEGRRVPQAFLRFEYTIEDETQSVTFAIDTWAATKLGLSLGQASISSTERVYADRIAELEEQAEAEAPTRSLTPSPYI